MFERYFGLDRRRFDDSKDLFLYLQSVRIPAWTGLLWIPWQQDTRGDIVLLEDDRNAVVSVIEGRVFTGR